MDVGSLAASLVTMQAASLQQAIATRVTRMSIDSEASVLQLLQPAQSAATADPGPGIGGNLDISA
jgi:hypothetical protein